MVVSDRGLGWREPEAALAAAAAFVDAGQGGDGLGCRMIYPDDDPTSRHAGMKQWTETI
jgi:hypothetical protein